MILTDREIQLALANGQTEISPPPASDAYASTSVDLSIHAPKRSAAHVRQNTTVARSVIVQRHAEGRRR
jgi:hypothetical protein